MKKEDFVGGSAGRAQDSVRRIFDNSFTARERRGSLGEAVTP